MGAVVAVLATSFLASCVEAIEMVTIVIAVGATRGWRSAGVGAAAGFLGVGVVAAAVGGIAAAARSAVSSIPRSLLQLVVGILLTSFGTFWAAEGLGVEWPGSDLSLLWILGLYATTGAAFVGLSRRRAFGMAPEA